MYETWVSVNCRVNNISNYSLLRCDAVSTKAQLPVDIASRVQHRYESAEPDIPRHSQAHGLLSLLAVTATHHAALNSCGCFASNLDAFCFFFSVSAHQNKHNNSMLARINCHLHCADPTVPADRSAPKEEVSHTADNAYHPCVSHVGFT